MHVARPTELQVILYSSRSYKNMKFRGKLISYLLIYLYFNDTNSSVEI